MYYLRVAVVTPVTRHRLHRSIRAVSRTYTIQEKDFGVGRQSLADKRREMVPALRDLYLETYSSSVLLTRAEDTMCSVDIFTERVILSLSGPTVSRRGCFWRIRTNVSPLPHVNGLTVLEYHGNLWVSSIAL